MSVWEAAARRVRSWLGRAPAAAPATFSWGPIDALIRGVWGPDGSTGPATRDDAMSLAPFERGCSELCAIATLPLVNYRGYDLVPNAFLDQPDPDVPRVVQLAQTIEDLICDGVSWWLKTGYDYRGFPTSARRVVNVTLQAPAGRTRSEAPLPGGHDPRGASVWVDGVETPAAAVIRFDSPVRPLLTTAARTIRRGLLLDVLAAMYAENPRPMEAFTDSDDQTVVPYGDEEIVAFLAAYKAGRKRGAPAWIPRQAQRIDVSAPSPAELQLVELQRQVSLELALFLGLDPEDVGVNTTSRTYFNGTDRDRNKINRAFAPYMSAIADRLSMGDVTPRGQRVRWDLADYLKPDAPTQAAYWQALRGMGVVDAQWIGQQAGIPAEVTRRAGRAAAAAAPALPAAAQENRAVILPAQLGPALTAARAMSTQVDIPRGWGAAFSGDRAGMTFAVTEFGRRAPATADVERRTITGLAVPYGAVARKYGVGFRFRPGSLEYDASNLARLRVKDDHSAYVGVHRGVQDTKEGPVVTLSILDGPEGSPTKMHRDQVLMDAAAGLYDGLSVGVDFSLVPEDGDVIWNESEQVFDVVRATWKETSVTPDPAFTGARVTRVAASRSGGSMFCPHCGRPHPPGLACATAAQLYPAPDQQPTQHYAAAPPVAYYQPAVANGAQVGVATNHAVPSPPPQLPAAAVLPTGPVSTAELSAALTNTVQQMVANGQVNPAPPSGQPAAAEFAQPVNPGALPIPGQGQPTAAGTARVVEPDPYRLSFSDRDGSAVLGRGTHEFSGDVIAALRDRDGTAHARVIGFLQKHMSAMFNVATTDVNEANPTRNRPDMYVDQRTYRYPLWSAINKGSLTDITPFTFPKFSSASSLVAAHTEGTEPSTGTFVTTGQTVTPTAYSGKARINREVWDQGGNPQISTLIWNQMVKGVNEALEAAAVTELNAGSFTTITLTAGNADTGQTLSAELEAALAALQFIRGGYAFTDGFTQADLYKALAAAKDADKRPLYPMIGPANANGQTNSRFGAIDVAGQLFYPEWALAAAGQTAAAKSYLIDRSSVHGWASAPQRLVLDEIAVAYVDLGVWGYQATAVSDTTGVRTISWDPVA